MEPKESSYRGKLFPAETARPFVGALDGTQDCLRRPSTRMLVNPGSERQVLRALAEMGLLRPSLRLHD